MKKNIALSLSILLFGFSVFCGCTPAGQIIWQINTPKTVYLTFDDGPDPVNTPIILDILKKLNVKAAFFVLGHKAQKNPAIIQRIKTEGHALGNHTFTHLDGYVTDAKKIKNELTATHNIIRAACGANVKLFRPPYGFFNWRAFKAAKQMDYQIILWTFDLSDWSVHSADQYVKTVSENLEDGAIILMHDGGPKREALIEALPKIIKLIKKKGYKFSNGF